MVNAAFQCYWGEKQFEWVNFVLSFKFVFMNVDMLIWYFGNIAKFVTRRELKIPKGTYSLICGERKAEVEYNKLVFW